MNIVFVIHRRFSRMSTLDELIVDPLDYIQRDHAS